MEVRARTLRRGEPGYPPLLAAARDEEGSREYAPPALLYTAGRDLDAAGPLVAIVGARRPSSYGREVARGLARDLAAAGVWVVSGMARGIDAEAHEGALAAGGATVAVLAGGVDVPYPPSGRDRYRRILAAGSIVSEVPPGTSPMAFHFVRRNRIIAGMCAATIVVQAVHPTSGSLSTAARARRYGRTVWAVPGDIRSSLSSGPHQLIRDGAMMLTSAADVLAELGDELRRHGIALDTPPPPDLGGDEAAVAEAVAAEPAAPESIAARSGLEAATVARILVRLELAGVLARGPGGTYYRVR